VNAEVFRLVRRAVLARTGDLRDEGRSNGSGKGGRSLIARAEGSDLRRGPGRANVGTRVLRTRELAPLASSIVGSKEGRRFAHRLPNWRGKENE